MGMGYFYNVDDVQVRGAHFLIKGRPGGALKIRYIAYYEMRRGDGDGRFSFLERAIRRRIIRTT